MTPTSHAFVFSVQTGWPDPWILLINNTWTICTCSWPAYRSPRLRLFWMTRNVNQGGTSLSALKQTFMYSQFQSATAETVQSFFVIAAAPSTFPQRTCEHRPVHLVFSVVPLVPMPYMRPDIAAYSKLLRPVHPWPPARRLDTAVRA
jgi:hypothetical protein